jgi:hypothetical protein
MPVANMESRRQNGVYCDREAAGKYPVQYLLLEFVFSLSSEIMPTNVMILESMRQLRWDILALADGFGLTPRPAKHIPPRPSNQVVHWVFPTGPSRRQKDASESSTPGSKKD